ncbi:MAG: TlpA family protein disulfide reductase [Deltaproteobacteria bacterium]|nr:TlpA family protein disulfide reductase [Deltaproteobacteria bacterium]
MMKMIQPPGRTHLFSAMFILLSLALLLSSAAFASDETDKVAESRILKAGTKAPDFEIQTIDGKPYHLQDHIGRKPILLFFWSFFCGPCREEMPSFQKIYSELGKDRLEFVGVNLDGKGLSKAIEKFLASSKMEFVPLFDELVGVDYKVADPYGIAGTPTVYIIDLKGNIAFSAVGRVEPDELKGVLEGILAGS